MTTPLPKHRVFSLSRVGAIASNTLLELIRLKVFYFLLLFALVLIGSSAFMVKFSFQEQFQVLKDVSLGAMSIFTFLLAVLSTAMLLPKDVEDRTLYTILAKPVPRFEYLLGKMCGVLLLLAIATVLMSLVFWVSLWGREQQALAETMQQMQGAPADQVAEAVKGVTDATFTPGLVPGIIVIYLKAALFVSLTLFVSTYATSYIFTVIVVFMVYLIGHVQSIAREYWLAGEAITVTKHIFLGAVALLFPDLQVFNVVNDIAVGNAVAMDMFAKVAGLGVVYLVIYLLLAYFVFAKKEL